MIELINMPLPGTKEGDKLHICVKELLGCVLNQDNNHVVVNISDGVAMDLEFDCIDKALAFYRNLRDVMNEGGGEIDYSEYAE